MEKYNSTDNQKQLIKMSVCDKRVTKEISADFTLPDYQPEIKRLLRIGAEVLSPECSFGINDCEISGNIDYYVIYLGADNQMYCAPLSSQYRMTLPLDDGMGLFYDGDTNVGCEFVSGRVTAKRKISIRSKLCATASIFNNVSLENEFAAGADPSYTERLDGEIHAGIIGRGVSETVRVCDELIPDTRNGEIRVICAEGKVCMSEVSAQSGEVSCKGDVYLKMIMAAETGDVPYTVSRKIPFAAQVPVAASVSSAGASASGKVNELSVTVEDGRIAIDMGVTVNATLGYNKPIAYTRDMYSTLCHTECDYLTPNVLVSKGGFYTNLSFGETRSLEELKISPDLSLVDISADAFIESAQITDGKARLSGNIKYTLLLYRDGEYTPTELEFPFVYTTDVKEGTTKAVCSCTAVNSRGRIDGERIGIDSEIYISGMLYGEERINALSALHFGELIKKDNGSIAVCYPARTDSLWSVGKRYRTTVQKLISDNPHISKNESMASIDISKPLDSVKYIIVS